MGETLKDVRTEVPSFLDKKYVIQDKARFMVVGDMHLNYATPKSRIDDYAETMMAKLSLLRQSMIENEVKYLICLGDIFHKPKQPVDFLFRVMMEFSKFKIAGLRVFSIFGNHDLLYDRLDSYQRTSLGLMEFADFIEPFSQITFTGGSRDVVIYGVHYPNELPEVSDFDSYNIVAAHMFYNIGADNTINKKELDKNNFQMYLLGHDHVPYDLKVEKTKSGLVRIVRPGSFSRGTAHAYNNARMVYVDIVSVDEKVEVIRETLNVKKPDEIFSASVVDKVDNEEFQSMLSKQLNDLVTLLYSTNSSGGLIYKFLDEAVVEKRVKNRIETYLTEAGIYRK